MRARGLGVMYEGKGVGIRVHVCEVIRFFFLDGEE